MARTVEEIKKEMTDRWIVNPEVVAAYELEAGKTFEEQFSKASLESLFFYDIAYSIWHNEKLFDEHVIDVNAELDTRLAHRQQWYRDKVLKYRHGQALITDTDQYDDAGLTPEQIEDAQVVKYCATGEAGSILQIKVAKGEPGARETLSEAEELGLQSYVAEIKDAGVLVEIINQQADKYSCKMIIYYNPTLLNPADKPVEIAIKEYVSNLAFNGEYSNMALVDHLQAITGVVIPHLIAAWTKRALNNWEACEVKAVAESGYFVVEKDEDLDIEYTPYSVGNVSLGLFSAAKQVSSDSSQSGLTSNDIVTQESDYINYPDYAAEQKKSI